jgi:predicted nucleic acid-binding protein
VAIVLDSSFLIAYHNERDVHHPAALQAMASLAAGEWGRALLLEYVFAEVVTVVLARRGLDTASRVASRLLGAREVDFVPCSDLFLESLETFRAQATGTLSFTDAAIVTAARRHEDAFVASFDTDFRRVEGIVVVPQ